LMLGWPAMRTLDVVLLFWALGGLAATAIGLYALSRLDRAGLAQRIDWNWIRTGLIVAAPLVAASLALRGVFVFDRFLVDWVADRATLGAYVLYISLATAMLSFIDAGIVNFAYPPIVRAAGNGQRAEFLSLLRSLAVRVTAAVAGLSGLMWAATGPLVAWLDKDIYTDNIDLMGWSLVVLGLYGLSNVPHIGLYGLGRDRTIMISQIAGLAVLLVLGWPCAQAFGARGVLWGLAASFAVVLVWKALVLWGAVQEMQERNVPRREP
jgi:O-antigen/teichoic acid export membrane protein